MAAGSAQQPYLWMDGALVPWHEATVHASTLGWSTMAGVFEGIKAYWNPERGQLYGWQLREHFTRLATSMRLMRMQPSFSVDELVAASIDLLRACGARSDTYVFPLAYHGQATWFSSMANQPTSVLIRAFPFQSHLGSGRVVRACVSSWTRLADNVMSPRIKCVSNYQNSRMALLEAAQHGCDQAIFLNERGKVAEGAASCLFMVRHGTLVTPPITHGVLESITRATLLRLAARELGLPVVEREVDRTELYVADEVFLCGTGAEVTPVGWVDGYQVGEGTAGPVTSRMEALYHALVRGRDERYPEWRTPILDGSAPEALPGNPPAVAIAGNAPAGAASGAAGLEVGAAR